MTSKVELPVRDRLAWRLSRDLGDEFIVSREWRRADIAVLAGGDVVAEIEAQAMYTFDIVATRGRKAYLRSLRAASRRSEDGGTCIL